LHAGNQRQVTRLHEPQKRLRNRAGGRSPHLRVTVTIDPPLYWKVPNPDRHLRAHKNGATTTPSERDGSHLLLSRSNGQGKRRAPQPAPACRPPNRQTGSRPLATTKSCVAGKLVVAMPRGRLTLPSGFSASCAYVSASATRGRLQLPSALYLPLRKNEDATLTLEDGSRRSVHVTFGPAVGEASFTVLADQQRIG
jgi:hypothetical protein